MGVTGLWRLIEPAGKPVPVETLENKVLAVDISIWLHQMVKGYQDAKGAPLPNAHLMGLFQRLCKLLYFRVKPVFVFDGGFPDLKKETIAKRQDSKTKYNSESERIKRELTLLLSKKTAISSLLGQQISPKSSVSGSSKTSNDDDIFKLPALPAVKESDSESDDEESSSGSIIDLHSIDIESDKFKKLSAKDKYDLLIELKETRKMNSWGRLHELPKKSDNFSDFQMQRLLKRRKVQECLEETEKEMGDTGMSLNELESLLNEEGIDTKIEALPRRVASNNNTRFLLINNVKQALAEAKKKKECENQENADIAVEENILNDDVKGEVETSTKHDELEDDLQKAIKMSLECVDDNDTSAYTSKTDDSWTSNLSGSDYSHHDSEDDDGYEQPDMSSAKAYIMQYSDFTHRAIDKLMSSKTNNTNKPKGQKVNQIIEELNREKSIIADNIEISDEEPEVFDTGTNKETTNIETDSPKNTSQSTMNATQASVVCIGYPIQGTITLDTSTEDGATLPKETFIKTENYSSDEFEDISELEYSSNEPVKTQLVTSEFENSAQNARIGNTSLEKMGKENSKQLKSVNMESKSSDDDDDFEDVPEIVNKRSQPVVEVTLNMGEISDEDIFADIFENNTTCKTNSSKTEVKNIVSENTINDHLNTNVKSIPIDNVIVQKKNVKEKLKPATKMDHEKSINTENLETVSEKQIVIPQCHKEHEQLNHTPEKEVLVDVSKVDKIVENEPNFIENPVIIEDTSKTPKEVVAPLSKEKLDSMVAEMENEEQVLIEEKGRLDRIGRNITEQMTKEAQELLQIFGIPYIVAPMEAEAQCAFLEAVNLTDGTITDDSDIWLFGGKTVYKNFFNQKKHVLQFLSERVEKSFNLTREQLVLLALLVGSDYTTGLAGVGPVTALEILASFPFNKKQFLSETSQQGRYQHVVTGLQEFKKWVRAGKRTDNTSLKKKLKNVKVSDDFPSVRVVQAYLDPNVEKSKEKFTWGELDITILRDYTKTKFGWSQHKLDEIIKPVLKRIQDRKSQKNIHDYFKKKVEFQSLEEHMSKRVKAAVHRMGPDVPLEEPTTSEKKTKAVRKRKTNKKQVGDNVNPVAEGPSKAKLLKKDEASILGDLGVRVVSKLGEGGKSTIQINIPKSGRVQEIIPQREKDKQCLLQNKMKAIETFRKSKIDKKSKTTKRRVILPKEKAELSESDSD